MQATFVGDLGLGFGLLFLGAPHLDHYADNRVPQHVEPIAHDLDEHLGAAHIDQHLDLAQRIRLHWALDLAFERKLTGALDMLNSRLAQ